MIGPKQASPLSIQQIGWEKPAANNTLQYEYQPISNSLWFGWNWFIWRNIFSRIHILHSLSYPGREYVAWTSIMHALYKRLYKTFVRSLISTQSTFMRPDWPVFDINVVSWYQQDVIVHFEEDTQHIRPICSWRCDTVVISQDFTAKCIVLLSFLEVDSMEFTSQTSILMDSSLFPWVHNGIKVRFCLLRSVL